MEQLFKTFDGFIANLGASSPLQLVLYKFLATIVLVFFAWLMLLAVISSVTKKMQKTRFAGVSSALSVPIKKIGIYIIFLISGSYLIRLFQIRPVEKIFYAIVILFIAKPLIDYVKIILTILEANIAKKTQTNMDDIVFELLNRFVGIVLGVTALVLSLDILGINVMPFIAGAGIVGVAIGFAAKDTLSNLIAGILLIIDRPFEIGDRIEVWSAPAGSSSWGDVIDIGLRATKIKTTDNIIVIIPNNEIMMRDIVNYTISSEAIRVRVNIGVAYDTNIARAKEVIVKIAGQPDWVMKSPAPRVVVRHFGDSSVDLQLRVWIKNARKRMDTISYITDHVKAAFDAEGIEIPYPKRDITIIRKNKVMPN
jgi:small-conductance mechanosensitive channel